MLDTDYLERYYAPLNERWLALLRGDTRFEWMASHGTYMRSPINPSTQSLCGDLNDENIDVFKDYAYNMLDTWMGWLENAETVPEEKRAELQRYDYQVRRLGYELDPMNKLAVQVFGDNEVGFDKSAPCCSITPGSPRVTPTQ